MNCTAQPLSKLAGDSLTGSKQNSRGRHCRCLSPSAIHADPEPTSVSKHDATTNQQHENVSMTCDVTDSTNERHGCQRVLTLRNSHVLDPRNCNRHSEQHATKSSSSLVDNRPCLSQLPFMNTTQWIAIHISFANNSVLCVCGVVVR